MAEQHVDILVDDVVSPEGAIGCIARRFEIALESFADLIPTMVCFFLGPGLIYSRFGPAEQARQ
jgi:hypothetical protein